MQRKGCELIQNMIYTLYDLEKNNSKNKNVVCRYKRTPWEEMEL